MRLGVVWLILIWWLSLQDAAASLVRERDQATSTTGQPGSTSAQPLSFSTVTVLETTTVINSVSNPTATISAAPADSESGQSMTSDTKVKLGLGIGLGVPCFCILSYMLYLLINLNRRHSALAVSLSISDNKGKERDQNLSSVFTAGSVDELPAHPPLPKKPELEGTSRHIPSPAASREPRFGSTSTIPGTHELRAESRGQSSVDLVGRGKCSTPNERTTPSPVVGSSLSKGVRRPDRTRRPETERRRRRREQGRD